MNSIQRLCRLVWTSSVLLALAFPAAAAETGRYQVVPGTPTILLDTQTGKTWRYGAEGKWTAIEFETSQQPQPKSSVSEKKIRKKPTRTDTRLKMMRPGTAAPASPTKTKLRELLKPLADQ